MTITPIPKRQRRQSYTDAQIQHISGTTPTTTHTEPHLPTTAPPLEDSPPPPVATATPFLSDPVPEAICHAVHQSPTFPTPTCANLTHDLGYCGPAALGLILHQLLHAKTITTSSHNQAYATPIDTIQRILRQLYPSLPTSLDNLTQTLSHFDTHQIQWLFTPVFRVLLLCILRRADAANSDTLFCDDQQSYFTTPPWHNQHATYINDTTITMAIEHLKQCNQFAIYMHGSDFNTVAHFSTPLQQDDLFVLCRYLNLKLDIQLACDCTEDMQGLKNYLVAQHETRMLEQCQYFGTTLETFVTVHILYYCLITAEQGISGHYDLIKDEALTQKILARHQNPDPISRKALKFQAYCAHKDPANWLPTQSSQSTPHTVESNTQANNIPQTPAYTRWQPYIDLLHNKGSTSFNLNWGLPFFLSTLDRFIQSASLRTLFDYYYNQPVTAKNLHKKPRNATISIPDTEPKLFHIPTTTDRPLPLTPPSMSSDNTPFIHQKDTLEDKSNSTCNTSSMPSSARTLYKPPPNLFSIPEHKPVSDTNQNHAHCYSSSRFSRRESFKDLQALCPKTQP